MTPPTLLAIALVVLSVVSALFLGRRRRSTVPGPLLTFPVAGETLELVRRGPGAFFMARYGKYGGLYRTSLFGIKDVYCVLEPSLARTMLRGDSTSFVAPFESIAQLIGDTGHMVDGPMHNYFRKILATSMSPAAIEQLLPRMAELLGRCLTDLESAGRQNVFDVGSDLATELALEVVFGLQLQHTNRKWFKKMLLQYIGGMFTILPVNLPGFAFHDALKAKDKLLAALELELGPQTQAILAEDPESSVNSHLLNTPGGTWKRAFDQAVKAAAAPPEVVAEVEAKERARINGLVTESMRRLSQRSSKAQSTHGSEVEDGSAGSKAAEGVAAGLIDAQLETLRGQQMVSPAAAAGRVLGTFTAAVDTTRNALMTILGLLAEMPEEGDKLRAEQDGLIAEHGEAITSAVLAGATYLDAFCRETLRMLPAARVGLRAAVKDLHWGGHVIPTGATLLYSIDCLHALDPVLWDGKYSPTGGLPPHMDFQHNLRQAFQPERWLSDATRPKQMFTFSTGSHLCLGMSLVYTELKVLTSLMVRGGYRVSFDKPGMLQHITLFPTMRPPKDNCHVRIWRPAAAGAS